MPCPLPARASVRDLLADLLSQPVSVGAGAAQQLDGERRSQLAVYRFDDGSVAALCVAELDLAVAAAAAIAGMPAAAVAAATARSELDGDLAECYRETVNVLSRLLNSPTTPHVVLAGVHPVPGQVPADVARLALAPAARADYRVTVAGYGGGALTFLARAGD